MSQHGIAAGRLRQSIEIQGFAEVADDFGAMTRTYSTRATVRAEAKQLSGTEEEAGGQYKGRAVYRFTIRATTITTTDRILYDSRIFEIFEIVDRMDRGRVLTVKAAELQA
ncbi:MAG: phage head closure protein [Pontiella sp.]|nr:phage head closure protein [Pontiella sp.]